MKRDFLQAFRGRRVLLIGDTGFKGSWLTLWLYALGAEVSGFALPPDEDQPLFTDLGLGGVIRHVDGDIRDQEALRYIFAKTAPEIVFHLAAQSLVRLSYDEPKLTFDTNIGGSVNVLEAVRGCDTVRSLVFVTSDKCYWNQEWNRGYREGDRLGGRDPYSASKAAAEIVFRSYMDSYFAEQTGFAAASARAGNVIGGGDRARDRIVPDCIRALAAGRPIGVRNPAATRPWQHVMEPLSGYLLLTAHLLEDPEGAAGSWNFGPKPDSARTVGDLVEAVVRNWGEGEFVVEDDQKAPYESTLLQLDIGKAESLLGWTPTWDTDRCISETVAWYRAVHDGEAPIEVTRRQIDAYMESMEGTA